MTASIKFRITSSVVGRTRELNQLLKFIKPGKSNIILIHGIGSAGKTALAFKFVAKIKSKYPEAEIFMNLKGNEPK
jgi:AAA+ ATPase superfamily predicted ATPase